MRRVPHRLLLCTCALLGLATIARIPAVAAEGLTGPAVGSFAPDFKARNAITGDEIPLSGQRGKVVVLTFWATWCGPCRLELPVLENVQRIAGKDNLTVLAVSFKENSEAWTGLKRKAGQWQITLLEDHNGWIARRYAISSIPHLFILDRAGKVLANHVGYGNGTIDELIAELNRALAEPRATGDNAAAGATTAATAPPPLLPP